ncbi:MAG: thiosulfate sulfurtransferase [Bacteroidetes bacterium]|nr:thiosulfate sulfurtransferase [Bacteroidota bacterium]
MSETVNQLSTSELLEYTKDKSVKIIDVRPVDAYNGWKLKGEKRGGHIKGAKSLPSKWGKYIDWIEIVRSKEILPEHKIIVYAYSEDEAKSAIKMFVRAGYTDVNSYSHFVKEWTADESLPMENLSRYRQLVSADWVKTLTSGETPAEYSNNKYVVCHAHYRNLDDYKTDHIPGAIALDTNELESSVTWNRRTPEELKVALEKHGITADTTVVLYGRFSFPDNDDPFPGSSAGHLGSIRCAFIMLHAGVKDVRVLNGGMQSWKDAGFEVTTEETAPVPVSNFGVAIPAQPQLAVDIPEAKEILASKTAELVSVRSWPEWIGEMSGYNYIEKKGRIPGAVFGNCGTDAYHMENYRNVDHTIKEADEVAKTWEEVGITPDKHLAFYCGTGWRGSEAFFNAWLMGWPRVSVFDGGWFEWSNDPDNPYETGIPQK